MSHLAHPSRSDLGGERRYDGARNALCAATTRPGQVSARPRRPPIACTKRAEWSSSRHQDTRHSNSAMTHRLPTQRRRGTSQTNLGARDEAVATPTNEAVWLCQIATPLRVMTGRRKQADSAAEASGGIGGARSGNGRIGNPEQPPASASLTARSLISTMATRRGVPLFCLHRRSSHPHGVWAPPCHSAERADARMLGISMWRLHDLCIRLRGAGHRRRDMHKHQHTHNAPNTTTTTIRAPAYPLAPVLQQRRQHNPQARRDPRGGRRAPLGRGTCLCSPDLPLAR